MTLHDAQDRSALAGEYVLGTMSAAERKAFEYEMQRDRGLLAEVYFWQDRLVPLAARVPAEEPDPALWPAIASKLTAPASRHSAVHDRSADPAANDAVWRRLRRWQWIGGCATAAAVVLATVLGRTTLESRTEQPARYLAVLQAPQDKSTGWVVEVTRGERLRLVPVGASAAVPAGKSLQFWTKPEGAAAPTSLGLVSAGRTTDLPVTMLPSVGERQLFEVTLEAEGGSSTGRPTGPILYVGSTVKF